MSDRRLIEERLPLHEVNEESAKEKSLRHGHISTLHLWWARRPLAMSRAVVYGTLLPDPGDDAGREPILNELIDATPFEDATDLGVLRPLRERLAKAYPDGPPKVLDCFAGGGAIPLEALRLGCDVTALDLNPVAHLIEKCVLEYPQRFGQPGPLGQIQLAEDFRYWASWVRNRVKPRFDTVFPADKHGVRPAIYFWARTMRCPNPACRAEIPLLKDRWLARNSRNTAWIKLDSRPGTITCSVQTTALNDDDPAVGTVRASSVTCPACSTSITAGAVRAYAKEQGFGRVLTAVLVVGERRPGRRPKREYRDPTADEIGGSESLASRLQNELEDAPDGVSPLPDEDIAKSQYRCYRNLVYGIGTFRGLFNERQLYVLGSLCEAVRAAHSAMLDAGVEPARATALATYLGLCVDRVADRNSSFCGWDWKEITIRNTFPQQAIRMAWNYTELDPLADVSGGWDRAVRWVEQVITHCASTGSTYALVARGDAQALPFPDGAFDAVVVDPPYYDAFQYGDLSDFFYVWLKRSIGHLHPGLFLTPLAPKQQEVIESRADPKSPEHISHDEFERRLQRALDELARVVRPDGMVSLVFGHTDATAWEKLLRALRMAGLIVTTSWPMRSEMRNRSVARRSAVLDSSVVLVCRPQRPIAEGFYDDVMRELDGRLPERLDTFDKMRLSGADYFVAAVGPAFEVFARYQRIVRLSGVEVEVPELMALARRVAARHAMRRLLGAERLAAVDDESIFYLTWRWAYGTATISGDEVYKLERAFELSLTHLTRPGGLVKQTGTTFSLLGPHERERRQLPASPTLIDVLHRCCQLWEAERPAELAELLSETGMHDETSFWAVANALARVLPDEERERTILVGLTNGQDRFVQAAASARAAGPRRPTLPGLERYRNGDPPIPGLES